MRINEIFETLASDNSRNFKIDYLRANSDNETLREVIRLALDPFTNFYIRKIPKYVPNNDSFHLTLDKAVDCLSDLYHRKVTGNAGIDHLKWILESVEEIDAKVIERVIKKDLKCGVSRATANAVWDNLIPEYPVMLCSGFEDKLVSKLEFPVMVNEKYDGTRFNCIVVNGAAEFRSRNGKLFDLLGNLEQEFVQYANGENVVFDGELLYNDGNLANRQIGNGIIGKSIKGTISEKEAANVNAVIWDVIPYNDFLKGECSIPYKNRFSKLENMNVSEKIHLTDHFIVDDLESVMVLFDQYIAEGKEGIIIKDLNKGWSDKRVKHQIKVKNELVTELRVIGTEFGTGKYENLLGNIICQSEDGIVKVSVGSGFSDAQREEFKGDVLINSIVSVKYNMRISNKNGEESLFLPIFLEVRYDKDTADNSTNIK